jgi:deoxyribonuclease V
MFACVDVGYRGDEGPAVASCVVYEDWATQQSHEERLAVMRRVAPYTPGRFYRRELPCILQVLDKVQTPIDVIVVDGYVWLDDEGTPGLGAHLFRAVEHKIPVIGIAKSPFGNFQGQRRVVRGCSRKPLFVTAAGIDVEVAARSVRLMHGSHRMPTSVARAHQLSRSTDVASALQQTALPSQKTSLDSDT